MQLYLKLNLFQNLFPGLDTPGKSFDNEQSHKYLAISVNEFFGIPQGNQDSNAYKVYSKP